MQPMRPCHLLAAGLALLPAPAWAQSTATFKGVDLYRSNSVTAEQVEQKVSPLLQSYLRLRNDGRPGVLKNAEKAKADIEAALKGLGEFAYAAMYYGEYITSGEHTAHVTFDVVEAKDAKARMPFKPAPAGSVKDPEGLLAAWQQFSELGEALLKKGELPTGHESCKAYYCLWGASTPELKALERRFVEGAPRAKKELLEVLAKEADPRNRAAAVSLLSYLPEGKEVVDFMQAALEDPAEEVRGVALQALSDIALYHKSMFLEVQKIIPALDFPTVSDRSKALGVLVALSDNPSYRPYVLSRATPQLAALLRMRQPIIHDLAFALLTMLSKESYDRRDYKAWDDWVAAHASAATVPSPPGRK